MKPVKNQIRPLAAIILTLSLLSLACGLSVGNLNSPAPTFTSASPSTGLLSTHTPAASEGATAAATAGAVGSGATPSAEATTAAIPSTGGQPVTVASGNLVDIYAKSNPGVVSILVQVSQGGQPGEGAGSGFILDNAGHVVTNHHVVDGANMIVVRFYNNADSQAKVVGDDPNSDLAILEVTNKAQGIHPLPLGDSTQARVGDSVVAIGNPFALGTSMSFGIVSAIGRTIPSGFTPYNIPQAIQTDAAINPGNSGGPLINMNGQVIGINAQIQTGGQGGGNVGIGFAIPVNILKTIAPSLIKSGSYSWPYLGVGQMIDPLSINAGNAQAQEGALINQITQGGPAARAGMQTGDIVIQADNQKITSFDDLLSYVAYKHPGDRVVLTVLRGGRRVQLNVTLGTRPSGPLQPQQ